jgi:hypothetical protein
MKEGNLNHDRLFLRAFVFLIRPDDVRQNTTILGSRQPSIQIFLGLLTRADLRESRTDRRDSLRVFGRR